MGGEWGSPFGNPLKALQVKQHYACKRIGLFAYHLTPVFHNVNASAWGELGLGPASSSPHHFAAHWSGS